MDAVVKRNLGALGYAQVLVVWKTTAFAKKQIAVGNLLSRHFMKAVPGLGLTAYTLLARPPVRHFPRLGISLGYVDRIGAQALNTDKAVKSIYNADQLSLIRPVGPSVPNASAAETTAQLTWGLQRLGVQALWNQGFTGAGVRVGHLDTGVDGTHPALAGRIASFAEFDFNGDEVPGSTSHDTDVHGTHTAGTICGDVASGIKIGVAPGAQLCSAIVIEGGDVLTRLLAGMEWILNQNVKVLSMSLGIRGFTPFLEQVTQSIVQNGVLPVFAIGNEGAGTSRSPGNYPEALSVGAMDQNDQVADFSSSITFDRILEPNVPIVIAPGVDVVSTMPGGGIQTLSGSSMATPHVAGIAALLFQAKPDATVEQMQQALQSTCIRLPGVDPSRQGFGLLNPAAILAAL